MADRLGVDRQHKVKEYLEERENRISFALHDPTENVLSCLKR